MNWRRIRKIALSGRAWLAYVLAVLAAVGAIYAHLNNWGFRFPIPLWKHELPIELKTFGKDNIDPIGLDVKRVLEAMNGLKIDLAAANGRNAELSAHIGHLNRNVDRLERLTDRVFGRASQPPGAPPPSRTPEAAEAAKPGQ